MISTLLSDIESIVSNITGWCSVQRAQELAAMIVATRPYQTTLIGVWGGREAIAMGLAHRAIAFGNVTAIDPWLASASVEEMEQANVDWWGDQGKHDEVYATFMLNVERLGLQEWITVRRERSDVAPVHSCNGILLVDGNHGPQAVKDVERFAPSVPVGGFAYLDDLKWSGGNVERAEALLLAMGFRRLYTRDTGAFYQRVS